MWKEFAIKSVDGKWREDAPVKNENEELEDIVKAYRARKYKDDSIWEMLGLEHTAFYDRLKKK